MNKAIDLKKILSKIGIELALIALIIVSASMSSRFLTVNNAINILRQVSVTGVIAVGMTIVIINGGIDLSVCGIVGLSGMTAVILQPYGTVTAIAAALLIGIIAGLINGYCISRGLAPFIMTMAMDTIVRGCAYLTSNGMPVSGVNDAYRYLGAGYLVSWEIDGREVGIPVPFVIFIVVIAIAYFLLKHTTFGRHVYAVGGNPEAARLSGISIVRTKMFVFAISGALAAVSAIMLTARMASCDPTLGTSYNVDAISATVIGGTSMAGGEGNVLKTIVGSLIIVIISNILNMMNVSPYIQQVITGSIIFGTVYTDNWRRTRKAA